MDLWWQLHAVFGTVLIKCTWRNQWTWWMNNGIDNIDCKVDKMLNKIWLWTGETQFATTHCCAIRTTIFQ
jgi:hypothetical protein